MYLAGDLPMVCLGVKVVEEVGEVAMDDYEGLVGRV